jgi:hypothetical protein
MKSCDICKERDIDEERDIDDWRWLCRKCHMQGDGRLENFKKTSFKKGEISKRWL